MSRTRFVGSVGQEPDFSVEKSRPRLAQGKIEKSVFRVRRGDLCRDPGSK